MIRKISFLAITAVLVAAVSGLCYSDPAPFEFKKALPQGTSTPEVSIKFIESERHAESGYTHIRYTISFSGLSKEHTYVVAMKGPGMPWMGLGDTSNGIQFSINEQGAPTSKKAEDRTSVYSM